MLTADGRLDRAALGRLVFGPDEDARRARRDLEAVVHPAVRARAAELEAAAAPGQPVVHVIPLLVETGQAGGFDLVVVVDVAEDVQRARLLARGGLSEEEADARIAAQASRAERLAAADVVLDNGGSREDLVRHVDGALGANPPPLTPRAAILRARASLDRARADARTTRSQVGRGGP